MSWQALLLSIGIYVASPLIAGYASKRLIIRIKGEKWFKERFLHILTPITITALLVTLVLIFSFKGDVILSNPLTILWIAMSVFTIPVLNTLMRAVHGAHPFGAAFGRPIRLSCRIVMLAIHGSHPPGAPAVRPNPLSCRFVGAGGGFLPPSRPAACPGFLFLPLVRGFRLPLRWSVRDGFRRGLVHHDSRAGSRR